MSTPMTRLVRWNTPGPTGGFGREPLGANGGPFGSPRIVDLLGRLGFGRDRFALSPFGSPRP